MKKLISLLFVISLIVPAVYSAEGLSVYSVSATTYPITEANQTSAQIDNVARIHHIILSNSQADRAQTVTFYENADSTTTITSSFSVDIPSTSANGIQSPIQVSFPIQASYWKATDVAVRKSSLASNVKVTIFYR